MIAINYMKPFADHLYGTLLARLNIIRFLSLYFDTRTLYFYGLYSIAMDES